MSLINRLKFQWQLAAVGLVVIVGCSKAEGPAVYPVTGVVVRDGVPMADVNVEFLPDKGRPSAATTDKEGKFVLEYIQGTRGAVKGAHKIRVVEKFQGATADGAAFDAPAAPPAEPKTYELPQPAQVNATKNSFVIDVTAGTANASS